jgi:hypothetical protein
MNPQKMELCCGRKGDPKHDPEVLAPVSDKHFPSNPVHGSAYG